MKKFLHNILTACIRPFYGSGIGNYAPFRQLHNFYIHLGKRTYFDGKNTTIKETKHDFVMELEIRKTIDDTIINFGEWEKDITGIFKKYLKSGDTFIDIGGNIGYFSLLWSQIVGKNGKVITFEPSHRNFQKLQKNISLNNFGNISAHEMGASNITTEKELFYNSDNPGRSTLVANQNTDQITETIKTIRLDDFLGEIKVDFIKMDIEGFEPFAIEWMEKILKKNNLKMVFEYSPNFYYNLFGKDFDKKSIKILDNLASFGFFLYYIDFSGHLHLIENNEKFFAKIWSKRWQVDIFCSKEKI